MLKSDDQNKNLKKILIEIRKNLPILVGSICKLLIKPIRDPVTFKQIKNDDSIIHNITSSVKLNDVIFISTDGTTIDTQEYTRTVGLNATTNLIWGPEFDDHIILKKYRESNYEIPSMISVERVQQELVTTVCILRAIKSGNLLCNDCPISKNNCIIKSHRKRLIDLENFNPVGLLDLTIDFSFIKMQKFISQPAKDLILNTVKWVYRQIREYNLDIIFITHGSRDKRFMYEIKTDIDYMFKRTGEFDKKLLDEIKNFCMGIKNKNIFPEIQSALQKFIKNFKPISEIFTDFDLFRNYFNNKGNTTPLFQIIDPKALDYYEGVDTAYFLTTWGYYEIVDNSLRYIPLDDIKIGFPLNNNSEFLYKLFLFDTALGKGHSLSLTLAHGIVSPNRKVRNAIAQLLADLHKIPKALKSIQKWRFS